MCNINLISIERIEKAIYLIRGEKVMLDRDLGLLYGVETNGAQPRRQKKSPAIPGGLHVSAYSRGSRSFEVPNWHLKRGPRWPALPALRFQGAGRGDAFECAE